MAAQLLRIHRLLEAEDDDDDEILRVWDLDENSTRYERHIAAPSDVTRVRMWYFWFALTMVMAVLTATVLLAILCHKQAKKNAYNLYLVYLFIPDVVFNLSCGVTCLLNALSGRASTGALCEFQSLTSFWGIACNNWMNFAIAHQLFKLLGSSRLMVKYQAPTPARVTLVATAIYVFAAFLASWSLWGPRVGMPHKTIHAMNGMSCLPFDYDQPSAFFFFLLVLPLLSLIPCAATIYIVCVVWYNSWMPPQGRRRLLVLYFTRIIAAYLVFWVPVELLLLTASGNPIPVYIGAVWAHAQSGATAVIAMTKPDVFEAVQDLLSPLLRTCSTHKEEEEGVDKPTNSRRPTRTTISNVRASLRNSTSKMWPIRSYSSTTQDGEAVGCTCCWLSFGTPTLTPTTIELMQADIAAAERVEDYTPIQLPDYSFCGETEGEVAREETEDGPNNTPLADEDHQGVTDPSEGTPQRKNEFFLSLKDMLGSHHSAREPLRSDSDSDSEEENLQKSSFFVGNPSMDAASEGSPQRKNSFVLSLKAMLSSHHSAREPLQPQSSGVEEGEDMEKSSVFCGNPSIDYNT